MNHVRLTHVGINAGMVPHSCGYAVRGRLRCNASARYAVNGAVLMVYASYINVCAMMYASNFHLIYNVRAMLSLYNSRIIKVVSKLQADNVLRYDVKASLCTMVSAAYAAKSVLFGGILFGYSVASHIVVYASEYIRILGNLHGINNITYRVMARINSAKALVYAAHGMVGAIKSIGYAVKSTLSTKAVAVYKTTASLKNTIGAWYYHCTGGVKLMAYVASVPHRIQEFITNKRWFR